MSFIRPEARAAIRRWREVLSGIGVALLGASWVLGPGGMLGWIGWVLIIAGLALVVVGVQRARFRAVSGGLGVVQVDEGQIAYLGPLTGGIAAIPNLTRLTLDPTMKPAHWVLEQSAQAPLFIPVDAEGVDALFDVFATLPGLKTQTILSALSSATDHPLVIWQRRATDIPVAQLH
jgi:hypothetical protein